MASTVIESERAPVATTPRPTTAAERLLLAAALVCLPLESAVPTLAGRSLAFLVFALMSVYAMLWRPRTLLRTAQSPIFVAGFGLVLVCGLVETLHGGGGLREVLRLALMFAAGVVVASLCRDRRALGAALVGFVLSGLLMAGSLIGSVTLLSGGTEEEAASRALEGLSRAEVTGLAIPNDLNTMAYVAAQGAIVAFALLIYTRRALGRAALLAAAALCTIGCFLPMSRGGLVILAVGLGVATWTSGAVKVRTLVASLVLMTCVLVAVPYGAFTGLQRTAPGASWTTETRLQLLSASVENLSSMGVGVERFWGRWGRDHGFFSLETGSNVTPHNAFAQLSMYWGVPALVLALVVTWQAARAVPWGAAKDPFAVALAALAATQLVRAMLVGTVHNKGFAVGLGLLAAAKLCLWPHRSRLKPQPTVGSCAVPNAELLN